MNFLPAVSKDAMKAMGREIRSWHITRRSDKSLDDLAHMFNNIVQGWINYYGRFYKSDVVSPSPAHQRLSGALGHAEIQTAAPHARTDARGGWPASPDEHPRLFAHWRLGARPDGWTMGAV